MNPLVLAFLLASGDAAAGRAIFHGKGGCVKCHSIENRGSVGPDLSEIGLRRTGGSLRLALVDPDAEIYEEYFTVVAVTKLGQRIEGIALNEDDLLIAKRNLANVELALGGERGSGLPEGVADLVLMANAYHEFSEPEAMLRAVRRALKPGGRLVVLEYAKENSRVPVSDLHKMSFEEIRSEIEPAGFELDRVLDFLPLQHGLIFRRRP